MSLVPGAQKAENVCQLEIFMPVRLKFRRPDKIRTSSEYHRVYTQGIKASSSALKIYLRRGEKKAFGVVISKRIKGAVKRNRYKRLMREVFRLNKNRFISGTQIVVVITKDIEKPTYNYFHQELFKIKQIGNFLCEKRDDHNKI